LRPDGDDAVLEIDDDGQGFDPAVPQTGHGLRNLKDRETAIGGRVAVESKAGEGTIVQIAIPIERESHGGVVTSRRSRDLRP
jgi:signal transduction histidine kinase